MTQRLGLRMALLLTVPPLVWAGNAVLGRMAVGSVPPVALNFARWLLVAVLLLPLGWKALRDTHTLRAHWGYLAALGLLGMGSYNALQYLALHTSAPLNVTLITASAPAWTLALGALLYGVRPRPLELLGAAMAVLGVLLVLSRGQPASLLDLHFVPGDLWMVVAVLSWSLYSWLLVRRPAALQAQWPGWDWAQFLFVQTLFGVAGSAVAAGAEALATDLRWHGSPWVAALLLYVAIGPSIIAYRCWGIGVAAVGPAVSAFFINLTPVFAALMSALLLGDTPGWYHGAAFALIVAGIVVSSRR